MRLTLNRLTPLLLLGAVLAFPAPAMADLDVEDRAPNFSWSEDGRRVSIRGVEDDWVVAALFIDPRSTRCLNELKEISRDYDNYRNDRIRWVAVVLDYGNLTHSEVVDWHTRNNLEVPITFDNGWGIARAYDLDGPCDLVLIDNDGDINFTGPFPRDLDDRLDHLRSTLNLPDDGNNDNDDDDDNDDDHPGKGLGHRNHDHDGDGDDDHQGEGHRKHGDSDDDDDNDDDDDHGDDDDDDDDDDDGRGKDKDKDKDKGKGKGGKGKG